MGGRHRKVQSLGISKLSKFLRGTCTGKTDLSQPKDVTAVVGAWEGRELLQTSEKQNKRRQMELAHTACKIQVSAKCSISQLEGIFIFMIMFHGYNGRVRAQPLVTFGGTFRRRGGSTSPRGGASTTLIPHHLERRTGPKIHPYSRSCAMDARIVIDRENRTAGSFIISIPAHTVIAAAAAAAAAAALWGRGGLSVVPGVTYAERSSCMT